MRKIRPAFTSVKTNMKKQAAAAGNSTARALEELFQALGDRTRLRLLNLMSGGEVCVCFFVEVLDEPQPKISRHLAYLRSAGLVTTTREGKWVHYRIVSPSDPVVAKALAGVVEAMATDPAMQKDREKLNTACCSPRAPEILRRAPKPGRVGEFRST